MDGSNSAVNQLASNSTNDKTCQKIKWSPSSMLDARETNITLILESWEFHVHKDVLQSSSDYFTAMFSSQMLESVTDVIEMHLVNPEHFKVLIEGMYTGILELTEENVFGVAQVGQMLQMSQIFQTKLTDFMRKDLLNLQHCLELMYFCHTLNIQEVYPDVRRFCLAHFSELRHSNSFLKLSVAELYDYLSDKFLVVERERDVVEAIHRWFYANKSSVQSNKQELDVLKAQIKKIVSLCVNVKKIEGAHDIISDALFFDEYLLRERFQFVLAKRLRLEEVFMFWALLTSTSSPDGLVDVVKLSLYTGKALKFDTMTDVVEKPGFQLGSALCALGTCVYLSGGGPEFGKANWIRDIWKFDMSLPSHRWSTIGTLIDFRRSHAMVILQDKLYIFGGFGKFRVKNRDLHSYDLRTGNWESLPPMPAHELDPATTVFDDQILYITKEWKVYVFSTNMMEWSELSLWDTAPHRPPVDTAPVFLFPLKAGDTDCFAVVTGKDSCLKILLVHIMGDSLKLYTSEDSVITEVSNFPYAGSVVANRHLVLFYGNKECYIHGENEGSHIYKAVVFDPNKNCFTDLAMVVDVTKAQSIIALPYLPETFKLGPLDFK